MSKSKSPARMLQKRTGWKYQECLRCVREMTPEAIEMLIKMTFDDESRARAHERVDRWMALYGLERRPRSALDYRAIDELAVSERIRGSAKRDA